jgi:hypothetical protein
MMIRSALEHQKAVSEMMAILASSPQMRDPLRQAELKEAIDAWECVNGSAVRRRGAQLASQRALNKTLVNSR